MSTGENAQINYVIQPATPERWADLEMLFGRHRATNTCWCMFWRLKRSEFNQMQSEEKKAALKEIVGKNEVPGLLAYDGQQVVGWCSLGPREQYRALENSRLLKRIDDRPVWSLVCFYVARPYRGKGVMQALVRRAVAYAEKNGARIIEGYPIDLQSPKLAGQKLTGYGGYMGIASVFKAAGFVEVGRASETQVIMRCTLPEST